MYNLVGFISIFLLILITHFLALRWPAVSKILYVALAVRILFLLINNHLFYLPDGDMDAKSFERFAWENSQDGFLNNFNNYSGPDAYFFSFMLAIPYSLFGRSILLVQSLSIFFGIASVFLGWLLAKKMWDNNTAIKVGWSIALFPTLVSYSVLTMREVYICFFLLLAMYGIVNWARDKNYKSIVIVIIGFVGATFFHGSSIIGLFVFLFLITLDSFKKTFKLLLIKRINLKILIIIIFSALILGLYFMNKIKLPYLQTFEKSINPSFLKNEVINLKVKGDAAYPEWTKIDSNIEFLYKIPIRAVYFIFSPFPWDVSKTIHLIGVLDSFLYMILVYFIFRNRKVIWNDPALRIILIVLIAYIIIYGVGVSNFGSSIRHRSKFAIEFILLAAPLIPRFIFFKKKD
jgi:4-amino-4-deoxy-L-arabinose transferase-like glycosyltransferase